MPLLPGASGHRGGALFLRLLLTSLGVEVGGQLRHREQRLIGGAQVGDDVGMFLLLMSHTRPAVLPFSFSLVFQNGAWLHLHANSMPLHSDTALGVHMHYEQS